MVLFPSWFCHVALFSEEQYWHTVSQKRLLQSLRHPSINITSTSCLNFSALMQVFSAGRFHSSHPLGKPRPALSPPSASSKAKRSCWLHLWEELLEEWHQLPTRLLTREAASTAANPNGLSEPPLPNSCTGYFLLNQGLSIFSQRKAFLNLHTPRGLCINWTLWTTSGILPCYIYYQGKNGILIDLFSTYFKLTKIWGLMSSL